MLQIAIINHDYNHNNITVCFSLFTFTVFNCCFKFYEYE